MKINTLELRKLAHKSSTGHANMLMRIGRPRSVQMTAAKVLNPSHPSPAAPDGLVTLQYCTGSVSLKVSRGQSAFELDV